MNFFTGRSLVSLYPQQTFTRKNIIFPVMDKYNNDDTTVTAIAKYEARGFQSIHPNTDLTNIQNHVCEQTVLCPHTIRRIGDAISLLLAYEAEDVTLDGFRDIIWRHGGDPCIGNPRGRVNPPMVLSPKGFTFYGTRASLRIASCFQLFIISSYMLIFSCSRINFLIRVFVDPLFFLRIRCLLVVVMFV